MSDNLLEQLAEKTLTKDKLLEKVKKDPNLIPEIINGMNSSKAAIRYGCGKVLMDFSEEHPEKLYLHWDFFINKLDSKYRILIWQSMAIIANLTRVDHDKKLDTNFEKYYSFIDNEYMVTVANLVSNSGKIANAKPYLIPKITRKLLKVDNIKTTPHLTDECKRVIAEKAIISFDTFFNQVEKKDEVLLFVKKHTGSSRVTLKNKAEEFLNKWKR